jgi:hypothetical protein
MSNHLPLRSRAEALILFDKSKGLALSILSRRFGGYSEQDREEYQTAAMLGLWQACQRFDPLKGFAFSTFATAYIVFTVQKSIDTRRKKRQIPCVSLSDPMAMGEDAGTVADMVAAPVLGSCPVDTILRQESINAAMREWQSFPNWKRGQKPAIAADIVSVFGRSPVVATTCNRKENKSRAATMQ